MYFVKKIHALLMMLAFTFVVGCASTETAQTEEAKTTEIAEVEKKEAEQKKEVPDIPGKFNLPPKVALNHFGSVEVETVTMSSKNASSGAGKRARRSIDSELKNLLSGLYADWSGQDVDKSKPILLVKTDVPKIKIVPAGARFWGGAFAGRSNITIKMTLVNKTTNEVIATSEFYRHSNAFAAAWTGGAADRNIVGRAVDLAIDYFEANETSPVKTVTGR